MIEMEIMPDLEVKVKVPGIFIREICESWPEASSGMCLRCVGFDYEEMKFRFEDDETGKIHEVDEIALRRGFVIFFQMVVDGNFKCGLTDAALLDAGNWDGEMLDGLAQSAIFGEVIYG
jgi:hypothetical protein